MAEDRVPLTEVVDKPKPVSKAENIAAQKESVKESGPASFMDFVDYHRACDHFDIKYDERNNQHLAEKISYLMDWAKDRTKSDDRVDKLAAIKNIASSLGLSVMGKELVTKLYQWVRLDQDRLRIEKEQSLIGEQHDRETPVADKTR